MVNVSTLIYVLENLEIEKDELFNVKELFDLESSVLGSVSGILDQPVYQTRPGLVKEILKKASID